MTLKYATVRGTVTVGSVCATHPALDASTVLTVSVTITPVFVSGGSSVEVSYLIRILALLNLDRCMAGVLRKIFCL